MTGEPVSSCCFAAIRDGERLGPYGPVPTLVCTECERPTGKAWDSLPPPGTFEAAPGKPFREADYR